MEDKYLELFIQKVKDKFGDELQRIILFGSRARGDNDPNSDYDLILIFHNVIPEVKEAILELEGEMLYQYNVVFSSFPLTELDLSRKRFYPFIMNVRKEGIML